MWSDQFDFFRFDISVYIPAAYDTALLHNQGQALAQRPVNRSIPCFLRMGRTALCHSAFGLQFV